MITHEEAAFLRSLQSDSELANNLFDWGFITYNLPDGSPCKPRLEEDGKAVLAEYGAHYTAIEVAELERLQALERKIEAFLGAIEIRSDDDVDIDIGDQSINVERLGPNDYAVNGPIESQLSTKCSVGNAMRKVFEMFVLAEGI